MPYALLFRGNTFVMAVESTPLSSRDAIRIPRPHADDAEATIDVYVPFIVRIDDGPPLTIWIARDGPRPTVSGILSAMVSRLGMLQLAVQAERLLI